MLTIVNTISSIDDSSKKILFKHFDQSTVNILRSKAPNLKNQLANLAKDTHNAKFCNEINSDSIISDDSGNESLNDCVNFVESLRK